MQKLNLPDYELKTRIKNGKTEIFDEVRKKYLVLTPEEWVRQNLIKYLINDRGTPAGLISIEKALKVIVIAIDGIAIIVHKDNSVNNLSTEDIRNIFSGKIENWQDLGGRDKKIIPVTREEGSGTRGSFEDMIMGDGIISDACLVQDSNGSVREIIATTPQGIGYISVGLVDEREKAVAINGVKPTLANLITCKYKFSRPFLLLLLKEPKGNIKEFIDYVLSREGQDILKKDGLIPATKIYND